MSESFFPARSIAVVEARTWDDLMQAGHGIAEAVALYAIPHRQEKRAVICLAIYWLASARGMKSSRPSPDDW